MKVLLLLALYPIIISAAFQCVSKESLSSSSCKARLGYDNMTIYDPTDLAAAQLDIEFMEEEIIWDNILLGKWYHLPSTTKLITVSSR